MNIKLKEDKFHVRVYFAPCSCSCNFCCLGEYPKNLRITFEDYEEVLKKFENINKTHNMRLRSFIYNCAEHEYLERQIKLYNSLPMEKNEYLQLDLNGTKIKNESEIEKWFDYLQKCGIQKVAFSWFGLEDKHDKFVNRKGYFKYLSNCVAEANKRNIPVVSKVFLYKGILNEVDELINWLEKNSTTIICALMEYSGKAKKLEDKFITENDYSKISEKVKKYVGVEYIKKFKSERKWIEEIEKENAPKFNIVDYILYLDSNNIERIKKMTVDEIIDEFRKMDISFQNTFESVNQLAKECGNKECEILYEYRDVIRKWLDIYFEKNNIGKENLFSFTKNSVEWKVYERL